jgi:hypothetical protein
MDNQQNLSQDRLSIPAYGRTIWSTATKWTEPLYSVYANMLTPLNDIDKDQIAKLYDLLLSRKKPNERLPTKEQKVKLSASALLSIWMISRAVNDMEKPEDILQAEEWFFGKDCEKLTDACPNWRDERIYEKIHSLSYDSDFKDLFPYIVEVFETEKVFKRRNPILLKRFQGLYYTPSDVCDYIVNFVLEPWNEERNINSIPLTCLDPACGSGVFLRAVLNWNTRHSSPFEKSSMMDRIYGIDVSHQAIQSCAFTLLLDCYGELSIGTSPWQMWQKIGRNLAVSDSTLIADSSDTHLVPDQTLSDMFLEVKDGFSAIIGNPPYLGSEYLPFVRMMWIFANKHFARAGMVLPLSIAYCSSKEFNVLRKTMAKKSSWCFAFFDRTPDSLFGDDVKTRNCIALADFKKAEKTISTTELRRWNSQSRANLFSSMSFTKLQEISIEHLIPKLGSEQEVAIYRELRTQKRKLGLMLKEHKDSREQSNNAKMFFRSTAYNWIPVFRVIPTIEGYTGENSSKFNVLTFASQWEADFAFAVASSRITYWLWRVEGDGFHLNRYFLLNLPFHPERFSDSSIQRICHLSRSLWHDLTLNPIQKRNAGILALSYTPFKSQTFVEEIDEAIIENYNLPNTFLLFLRKFVAETIEAGRTNSPKLQPLIENIRTG